MRIEFPKRQYTIDILTPHANYLDEISVEKEMTPSAIIMQALTWYQMINNLPGARDAVLGCKPQILSKKAPMPTLDDFDKAIERLEKE